MADILTEGLKSLYNAVTGTEDYRNYDFVIEVDVVEPHEDGQTFIYTGKDGETEIRLTDTDQLEQAQEQGLGNFLPLSILAEVDTAIYQANAEAAAAELIQDLSGATQGVVSSLDGYNINGDGATPKDLSELKGVLIDLRDSYVISDTPLTGESFADDNRQGAYETSSARYNSIDTMINQVDVAIGLPEYKQDFIEKASPAFGDDMEFVSPIIDPIAMPVEDSALQHDGLSDPGIKN